jgi:hypothetical protein
MLDFWKGALPMLTTRIGVTAVAVTLAASCSVWQNASDREQGAAIGAAVGGLSGAEGGAAAGAEAGRDIGQREQQKRGKP